MRRPSLQRLIPPVAVLQALLVGALALAGWLVLRLAQTPANSGSRLSGTVYLVVGINSNERLDSGLREQAAEALERWLAWLQNASLQQRITFHDKQEELIQQLASGNLD